MKRNCAAAFVVVLLLTVSGCAYFKPPKPAVEDVEPRVAKQREEIIEEYDERRDVAELQAARAKAEHGDLSGCTTTLEKLLERSPTHREARLLMADVQLARENVRAAEQMLTKLVQDFPEDAASHHALALLYESTGRRDLAQRHFDRAATLDPDDPLVALSASQKQELIENAAQIAVAAAGVAIATSPTPEAAAARTVIAAAKTPEGQAAIQEALTLLERAEEEGALSALRHACTLEPQNSAIPLAAAVHLLRSERADAAIVILEAAADRLPQTSAILRALGAAYLQSGDLHAAQVVLQQAISLDSNDALAYFLVGQVLQLQGQPAQAREAMRAAAKLDSRYAEQR